MTADTSADEDGVGAPTARPGDDADAGSDGPSRKAVVAVLVPVVIAGALSWTTELDLLVAGIVVALVGMIGLVVLVPATITTADRRLGVDLPAWILAIGVYLVGVAVSYVIGDPRIDTPGVTVRGSLTPYGIASGVFAGSCLALAIAAGHLGRYRRLQAPLATAVAVVTGPPGPDGDDINRVDTAADRVAVEGTVEPLETVHTPAGRTAVWYRQVVSHDRVPFVDTPVDGDAVPFYVRDDTGRVLVVPEAVDEHLLTDHLSPTTPTDAAGREWALTPGTQVTVVGAPVAVDRSRYSDSPTIGPAGPVIVAAADRTTLLATARRRVLAGAAFVLLIGLPAFLATLWFA